MKKIFLIGLISLTLASLALAQATNSKRIQQMRVEFFDRELQFNPAESEAFWPLYNEFREGQKALKTQYRTNRKLELMSDKEAEEFVNEYLDLEEKQLALKREYIGKLRKVINIRKVAMINRTERKFKQSLLNRIQERKANRRKQFN